MRLAMKTMMGSTLMARTKPTVAGIAPPGPGVCTMVTAGQSPKTNRIPASVKPMNVLARSLAQTNRRAPSGVRRATMASASWMPRPQAMTRASKARRRSREAAQAMPRSTTTPRTPIGSDPVALDDGNRGGRGDDSVQAEPRSPEQRAEFRLAALAAARHHQHVEIHELARMGVAPGGHHHLHQQQRAARRQRAVAAAQDLGGAPVIP